MKKRERKKGKRILGRIQASKTKSDDNVKRGNIVKIYESVRLMGREKKEIEIDREKKSGRMRNRKDKKKVREMIN